MNIAQIYTTEIALWLLEDTSYRDTFSMTYAMAMCSEEDIDWHRLNLAIIEKWSKSGLVHIKRRARKLIDEKRSEP